MAREGDLILVHVEDKPAFFARIEWIEADAKRGWYQVALLVLRVPLVQITWILRQEYLDGATFTMGGKKVEIERVVPPVEKTPPEQEGEPEKKAAARRKTDHKTGKVISLFPEE
jgi:hypothetical protein